MLSGSNEKKNQQLSMIIVHFIDALIFKSCLGACLLVLLSSLAIISLVLAILVSVLQFYNIIYKDTSSYPPAYALSTEICDSLEREIIANYAVVKKLSLGDDFISLKVANEFVDIHSVIMKNTGKPKLFWIHGVGGTATISFVLSHIMHKLREDFEIYAFDLPGFGRSSCPQRFKSATVEEVEDFYIEVILAYFDAKSLDDVYLCAHSFGAHFAIKFASRYPLKVQQLALSDPAGLFPMLGKEGAYYSLIFKWGVPMCQIRSLGIFGAWIFNNIVMLMGESKLALYWFQVQANPLAMSDHIVAKFIRTNFVDSFWTRPNYRELLRLSMPVAFIYGEMASSCRR
jgi:pimeloyl-ACP methyl ester carboxylesterase